MSIFFIPVQILLYLIFIAASILQFFLLVRAVLLWRQIEWLKAFDKAGKDLVDKFLDLINQLFCRTFKRHLSAKGNILLGIIFLELIRLLTGVLG